MTEAYESVLRKSLDDMDRRFKGAKTIVITEFVLACIMPGIGLANLENKNMTMLYIVTYIGFFLFTGGMGMAILSASNDNTQLILKAIALVSEANGNAPTGSSPGTADKREG